MSPPNASPPLAAVSRAVAAFVALLAAPGAAPAAEGGARPSALACPASTPPRELGECLRRAEAEAGRALAGAVEAARATIERAPAPPPQRARWRRLFDESQGAWARLRGGECQDLAPFEAASKARVFEEQAACRIDRDAARAADLRARYGEGPPRPAVVVAPPGGEPGAPAGGRGPGARPGA